MARLFSIISCWEHGSMKPLLGAKVGKQDPKAAIESWVARLQNDARRFKVWQTDYGESNTRIEKCSSPFQVKPRKDQRGLRMNHSE